MSRVAGSQLVYRLAPLAAQQGWRLFFLEAETGVAEDAAQRLRSQYPGSTSPSTPPTPRPRGPRPRSITSAALRPTFCSRGLRRSQTGSLDRPQQRKCRRAGDDRHRRHIDVIAGRTLRPPQWLHDIGLEWLFRLWKQPSRWRRQLRLPVFVVLIIAQRLGMLRPRGA
ncbi:MAG: WecB/TagA/CpsF family glycosyltransferase [Caldilineaceae bacterium]